MHYFHKNFSKRVIITVFVLCVSGCSSVVEPIKIPDLSPKPELQEQFAIDLIPLTFAVAKELNLERYSRQVSIPSNAFSPKVVSEDSIQRNKFPPGSEEHAYRLGVGDEINLVQSINAEPKLNKSSSTNQLASDADTEQVSPMLYTQNTSQLSNIISTTGRVASDGSLLLIGVGRLEAKGRYLTELQNEVRGILIRKGEIPNFQLEIAAFNSQKAFITTDTTPSETPDQIKYILPITDRGTTLREIVAKAGIPYDERVLTLMKIHRGGKSYSFTMADLFSENAPTIYLKDMDHVFIQNLKYIEGKVFLVGGVKPKVISIQPEFRQTLAEILFAEDGPLGEATAQRSAVYLMRGHNPIKAYHLDAQNPARILVADAVEMRPDDIVYVAEQPINTFNRVLSTILPLRLFSRDVKNDNLP